MKLIDILANLVTELNRIHEDGQVVVARLDRGSLPTFTTAKSGNQIHFTLAALRSIATLSDLLYKNMPALEQQIGIEAYTELVTQAVADCFASPDFDGSRFSIEESKKRLKKRVEKAVGDVRGTFTHYFPAWTLGVEATKAFAIGPVKFLTREQWVDTIKISQATARAFSPNKSDPLSWRKRLRRLLEGKARRIKKQGIADWLYRAIKDTPSVLKIRIAGCELNRSKQLARYVCKTALDGVALLFDDSSGEHHRQFVLANERLIPIGESSLVEKRGFIWLPGSKLNVRGWMGNGADALAIVNTPGAKKLLPACGKVIKAILKPASFSHPLLAHRWATALTLYSEGCREVDDALALAKIGSSMDILSGGGEEAGIRRMLLHLTKSVESDIIVKVPHPLTFKQVVERIYKHGRSQVLHGNHIDPMTPFASERHHATRLARIALRETVLRLPKFTGLDVDTAFQSI